MVTAVGMFGGGGGYGITPIALDSLNLVVGGVSTRPRAIDGQVEMREVLDLSVTIDHAIVDGAPAARFFAELRPLIEGAELLPEPHLPGHKTPIDGHRVAGDEGSGVGAEPHGGLGHLLGRPHPPTGSNAASI